MTNSSLIQSTDSLADWFIHLALRRPAPSPSKKFPTGHYRTPAHVQESLETEAVETRRTAGHGYGQGR
uniref:Uncharacterized protein n=1 Tax=Arundo donax TaxID=35708 RepID=A0A0A9BUL6_ARUDO